MPSTAEHLPLDLLWQTRRGLQILLHLRQQLNHHQTQTTMHLNRTKTRRKKGRMMLFRSTAMIARSERRNNFDRDWITSNESTWEREGETEETTMGTTRKMIGKCPMPSSPCWSNRRHRTKRRLARPTTMPTTTQQAATTWTKMRSTMISRIAKTSCRPPTTRPSRPSRARPDTTGSTTSGRPTASDRDGSACGSRPIRRITRARSFRTF
mmetsp:Transcript_23722/g.57211  ORF Transcript_23722/g.57211 Transcript_23722/m.57211 type:complete len:210 (-) Transcript_23722:98-727(-)